MTARGGYTLVELMIASFLSVLVVLALGWLILTNQRSWERGRDKVELQANTTEALEWMARQIRPAHSLAVPDSNQFVAYDRAGTEIARFQRVVQAGQGRLRDALGGNDVVARDCTRFHVRPDADTTSVVLTLELRDRAGNRVGAAARAAVRNRHRTF
jgi:hypothetical protein